MYGISNWREDRRRKKITLSRLHAVANPYLDLLRNIMEGEYGENTDRVEDNIINKNLTGSIEM